MYVAQGKVPFPENYTPVINQTGMLGLNYTGKKGNETIIPQVCTDIACFNCMGKILIVYSSPLTATISPYTIRNKRGNLNVKVPVFDFFAGTTYMYILTPSNRGELEWAKLNPDLSIERFVGVFQLHDYAVKDGVRVLCGSNKSGLDVLDRHGKTARIIFKTGEVEDVITFSKSAKASLVRGTAANVPKPTSFSMLLNLTTNDVSVAYDNGETERIANIENLSEVVEILDSMLDDAKTSKDVIEKSVKTGRIEKVQSCIKYSKISLEYGKSIIYIFKSLELYGKGAFLLILTANMYSKLRGKALLDKMYETVCQKYTDINDKYSFKIIFCYSLAVLAVRQKGSGRVTIQVLNWEEADKKRFGDLPEYASKAYGMLGDSVRVVNMECIKMSGVEIKQFGRIPKCLSAVGSAKRGRVSINNPRYSNGYTINVAFEALDNPESSMLITFNIFDGFSYDNYSPKEVVNGEQLSKQAILSKKYNDKNFVLNTRTNGFVAYVAGGAGMTENKMVG